MSFSKSYINKLTKFLETVDHESIDNAISLINKYHQAGRNIIVLGNGGSAMTALHFVTDWNKSIYLKTGIPFYGRTLLDNIGLITAYANDISYQDIFVEQLKNLLTKEDLVIAISGSGNSPNVINAVDYASSVGATTLGLCGYRGGLLKEKATHVVWADIDDMQIAEDLHSIFGHIYMQSVCGM